MKLNTYLSLLLLILVPSQATAVTSSPRIQQGDSLVQEGLQYLNTNQPQKALQRFQDAESVYEDAQHPNGFNGAVINQGIALKRLGQYYRACSVLTEVLTLNREICQRQPSNSLSIPDLDELGLAPEQQLAALQNLGNNLQLLGQLESSVTVLKQATTVDPTHPDIILSLANSYQSQYKDAINKLSISIDPTSEATATNTAQEKALEAISLYTSLDSRPSHRVHAQLNSLQLIQHLGKINSSSLRPVYQQSQHLIKPYISNLTSTDFGQFHEVDAVNLELKLSGLLNDLGMTGEAFHHARSALAKANILQDSSLRSQAFGTLGKIYLGVDQLKDAKKVFSKALKLAQSSNDDSLAYQWSWQLAQIYQQSGQRTHAIAAYDTTITHLNQVRTMLISASSDLQFSYKSSVEPVYQEYIKLLLSSPSPNLQLVLDAHQQLQVAELENYLKCGKLVAQSSEQQASYTATIHILDLNGQIEIIAQTPEGIFRHQPDSSIVQQELFKLLTLFDGDSVEEISEAHFLRNAQILYSELIAPLSEHLPPTGDLLFVLDSRFQNLPLSLLHDGQGYLIQNYSVTNSLNTYLQTSQPRSIDSLKVLFAGLSQDAPSLNKPNVPSGLPALPEVEDELREVQKLSQKVTSLINSDFTTDRLKTAINQETPIVHIASHGQFSSDPQKTFLLAYDEPINAQRLHDLINQKSELGQATLELLILSACETAKGDRRSALGITGLAIQAGSKNTLASLWLAESRATTELITAFYQGLKEGRSKAQALQQAQLKLLESNDYWHPYFWGNFILVGS
ncbi:CHAT domain-containing protein (plasmid) [Acaryochloris sp. 'Moss Beach']|uniref:CHAT domain-containing protein n=1 Tax=Acaryochloris sp. 'Moss Beach' TaxID=2740837 RepID=UPI001F38A54C|nr:CHAT domain-containing protein [Acaryochloris sp. 'Moss Beach']UJB72942.1 CHAT domain-containing protein [Acaryochloris sp. 'Moss Beach']